MTREIYAGLMSGTSLDGVDAVLVDFGGGKPRLMASSHLAFDDALRGELLALNTPGADEIDRAARAGNALARTYAAAIADVLAGSLSLSWSMDDGKRTGTLSPITTAGTHVRSFPASAVGKIMVLTIAETGTGIPPIVESVELLVGEYARPTPGRP